jgi:hypothetical protein
LQKRKNRGFLFPEFMRSTALLTLWEEAKPALTRRQPPQKKALEVRI